MTGVSNLIKSPWHFIRFYILPPLWISSIIKQIRSNTILLYVSQPTTHIIMKLNDDHKQRKKNQTRERRGKLTKKKQKIKFIKPLKETIEHLL